MKHPARRIAPSRVNASRQLCKEVESTMCLVAFRHFLMRFSKEAAVVCQLVALTVSCGPGPQGNVPSPTFDQAVNGHQRVLWVAAHPDDESLGGGALSRACVKNGSVCHFLVLTRGAGGECCIEEGCHPDLGTVRHGELVKAARAYHATLEHYDFFNAPLPVESFPTRQELEKKWMSQGDPTGLVARAVRRFQPDYVLTLDAYHGFTGHPEHQATARFALAGIRLAGDADADNPLVEGLASHRVRGVFHVLNKYWIGDVVGLGNDPLPFQEALDSTERCDVDAQHNARTCLEVFLGNTRVHRSQYNDMNALRLGESFLGVAYVRRIDPFGPEASALVEELAPASAREGK
jgi:LmbE family N-acetylglucosaminyl deacetylase